ncbi:LLM class flavin-dependent oxidoreductase [Solirubrobacter soli]|uniref:LLM class flavin-dependent oxidoreductase n=1 Tax=Solirubrobacter soli TaxID=363832 RepID=UPI0004025030|nr:LLM class flavin-dependent oxidoreductase [Solirubrobacter soli]
MNRAIFIAPFDELSEPARVAELAERAERRGWDGFFLWDHIDYRPPVSRLADPWITMAAIVMRTERLITGPLVTPLARRRPQQLAREAVTLDRLSGGRLVLGVGAGSDRSGEFERFGEVTDMKERARLLDDGLAKLQAFWAGELEPRPVNGTIPIWVAARWPFKRGPLERAKRYDGVFPIDQETPDVLAELIAAVGPGKEIVVTNRAGTDPAPWAAAGATWCLTGFGPQPTYDEVARAIDAG